jgi:ABC-type phosphate transport system substrate-binding protein
MRKHILFAALALVGLLAGPRAAAAQNGFVVIVNDANATRSVSRDDLSRIFLRQRTDFPSGAAAAPVDLAEGSSVREAFSQAVHGRSAAAVQAYWQRQIFSGRGVPPIQKASDDDVVAYVRSNPGAVGYVSRGTALGGGVHVVQVGG